ncbi:MAG: helix-turn-helix transcriptional regulator, partial [Clostridia bacterium]|nr:helix-turn-helix transcriptional regulator [Clostridia bacterium]
MSIGTIIKKLCRERDMTQEELAGLLNLTPAAVSGWECDRNAQDISQLPLLAHIFSVSADVLLGIDVTAQEEKIESVIARAESLPSKEAASL